MHTSGVSDYRFSLGCFTFIISVERCTSMHFKLSVSIQSHKAQDKFQTRKIKNTRVKAPDFSTICCCLVSLVFRKSYGP